MCECNNEIKVKIKKLYPDAIIPKQATVGSAGFDLSARLDEETIIIPRGDKVRIDTGLAFELPENHVMIIAPRSSSGIKKSLMLQNTIGVLDADYRGHCFLFVKNTGKTDLVIENGERIAQAVILPYPKVMFEEVEELSNTERGEGGFGSSGRF